MLDGYDGHWLSKCVVCSMWCNLTLTTMHGWWEAYTKVIWHIWWSNKMCDGSSPHLIGSLSVGMLELSMSRQHLGKHAIMPRHFRRTGCWNYHSRPSISLTTFTQWLSNTYSCCRHLRQQSSFTEAISNVLSMGGDTDTNAAIVGGLVGALHGAGSIPDSMKAPLLARDSDSPGIPRPEFLTCKQLPAVCQQIFQLAS